MPKPNFAFLKQKYFLLLSLFIVGLFLFCTPASAEVLAPGNISTCGELAVAGTYSLTSNVGTSGVTCFTITAEDVIITNSTAGIINGNIVADAIALNTNGFSFDLKYSIGMFGRISSLGNGTGLMGTTTFGRGLTSNYSYNRGVINANAVFYGNSYNNTGTINGNATFYDTSENRNYGTVNGYATFYGSSQSYGDASLTAGATFNDSSFAECTIIGNVIVNASSTLKGWVTGNVTYNGTDYTMLGTVSGTRTFTKPVTFTRTASSWTYDTTNWIFASTSNWILISSANTSKIKGDAIFTGNNAFNQLGASVSGTSTFNSNTSGIAYNEGTTTNAIFNGVSYNKAGGYVSSNAIFNAGSYNLSTLANATFNATSSNRGIITSTSTYNGSSYNQGTTTDAIFNETGYNIGTVLNLAVFTGDSYSTSPAGGSLLGSVIFSNTVTFNADSTTISQLFPYVPGTITFANPATFILTDVTFPFDTTSPSLIFASTSSWILNNSINAGNLRGLATFNGTSTNIAIVTGDAVFNSGTYNIGGSAIVTGNATFNSSTNLSTVSGDAIFRGNGSNNFSGVISGGASFYDSSTNGSGLVSGGAIFNDSSWNASGRVNNGAVFNNSSWNQGPVSGTSTFNNGSYNTNTITGNAIFNSTSTNRGTVSLNATFNGMNYTDSPVGTVGGLINFSNPVTFTPTVDWTANTTAWNFASTSDWIFNGSLNNAGTLIGDAIFNGSTRNGGPAGTVQGTATFNDSSWNRPMGTVGYGIFNDISEDLGLVINNATFNNTSYIFHGNINGIATFNDDSYADGSVINEAIFNDDSYNKSSYDGRFNSTTTFTGNSYSAGGSTFYSPTIILKDNSYIATSTVLFQNLIISATTSFIFYGDTASVNFDLATRTKTLYYSTIYPQTNLTRTFATSGPWTIVADGVVVDMRSATYDPNVVSITYTTFTTLNGGSFIFNVVTGGGHRRPPPITPPATTTPIVSTTTPPVVATTTPIVSTTTQPVIATTTPITSTTTPIIIPDIIPPYEPPVIPDIIPDILPPVIPPSEPPVLPPALPPVITPDTGNSGNTDPGNGGGLTLPQVITSITEDFVSSYNFVKENTAVTTKKVKEVVNSPVGSISTKVVTTAGVVTSSAVAMTSLFLNPTSVSEVFLLPFRLWGLFLSLLGIRRRSRPWGTVYDSITKQPLDPAYVVLKDNMGKDISTSITDLDGRYGFSTVPGQYTITANKTNYTFPSKRLVGQAKDELYNDLYFGESLTVTEEGAILAKNIPLDPEHFDWNEVAKRNMGVMRFYSKYDLLFKRISNVFFTVGFLIAVIAMIAAPYPYNSIIFGLYLLMAVLRIFGVKPKYYGWVLDQATGAPLAFSIVHIYSLDLERELTKKVCDSSGRYYALVPPGRYTLTIDRKNEDHTYTPVFTTDVIEAKGGVVNRVVRV